ncbi:MAG: ATP-binding cassette domain-containing protein [Rhodospirillaceae bacterium]|nr:ATP-binding cassette domain-containing protein [Rhodospirillaceae bacterium]MBL6931180.1 ATP-binding cassette domain-containing protein [Rhodospirillales bacterium]
MKTKKTTAGENANGNPETEILIKGLHKSFDSKHVLKGVDLDIQRNSIVAIVGGSGCGKTVLLNHILGLLEPDKGHVLVSDHDKDGEPLVDLADLDENQMANIHMHWGVVFQNNALFSGSVYDNIALWLSETRNMEIEEIEPIARKVLDAVSLSSDQDFLDLDVHDLSGGMAKRLAVARALAMNPQVIFYDEPTTGLDPTSAAQIHDLIVTTHEELMEKGDSRTTLIITHDKDLLNRMRPRTVMMHEGEIFFDGSLEKFEKSKSPYIRPYFDIMPILHGGRKPLAD